MMMAAADHEAEFDPRITVLRGHGAQFVPVVIDDRLRGGADNVIFYSKTEVMDHETRPGHSAKFCRRAGPLHIIGSVAGEGCGGHVKDTGTTAYEGLEPDVQIM